MMPIEGDRRCCPPGIEIVEPESPEDLASCFRLRWQLLRAPWNQAPGSEQDGLDNFARHVLARTSQGEIVGVGRVHFPDVRTAQIRYMATKQDYRGLGIGTVIANRLEQIAVAEGARQIILDARETAAPFYERLGYRASGEGHTLFGTIRHKRMKKLLAQR